MLALGGHHQAVAQLAGLIREHPLRERLRGQLMVALYRCGRQADALAEFAAARRVLAANSASSPARRCSGCSSRSSPPTRPSTCRPGRARHRRAGQLPAGGRRRAARPPRRSRGNCPRTCRPSPAGPLSWPSLTG